MYKMVKKGLVLSLAAATIVSALFTEPVSSEAAVKLSTKSVKLEVGKKYTIKVKGTKKKAKWSSAKKSVAVVNKKGVVTGVGKGSTKITAKIGKKKLKCSVKVTASKPVVTAPVQSPVAASPAPNITTNNTPIVNAPLAANVSVKTDKLPSGQILMTIQNNNTSVVTRASFSVMFKDASGIILTTTSFNKYDIVAGGVDYEIYSSYSYGEKIDVSQTVVSINLSTDSSRKTYCTDNITATMSDTVDGSVVVTYASSALKTATVVGTIFFKDSNGQVIAADELYETVEPGGTKFEKVSAPKYMYETPDHQSYDPIPYAKYEILCRAYYY